MVIFDENIIRNIIFTRTICSCVSMGICSIVIILYIVLFIQSKLFQQNEIPEERKENSNISKIDNDDDIHHDAPRKNFGLGSHTMFFLMLSNVLWTISSIYVGFYFPEGLIYETDRYETECPLLGFFHNYFDLCIIGWTTMLSHLFLKSNQQIRLNHREELQIFIFSLFYSFLLPLFICLCPFHTDSYGPGVIFCTLGYLRTDHMTLVWMGVIMGYTWINLLYVLYALIKMTCNYSKKLRILKETNALEYKMIHIYLTAFKMFLISLIISRGLKEMSRLYEIIYGKELTVLLYIDGICFCLGGTFNGIFCFFFFRGVFSCSKNEKKKTEPKNPKAIYKPDLIFNQAPIVEMNNDPIDNDDQSFTSDISNIIN